MKTDAFQQWTLVFTFIIGVLKPTQGWSQIENMPVSEEVRIDKLYAGLLAETRIVTASQRHHGHLTFQSGARIRLTVIPEMLWIRSFGVLRVTGGEATRSFTNFEMLLATGKKVTIHLGVMATPTTELRPNPATWQSQVETHAESTLPGGRPGIKVNYQWSKAFKIVTGVHQQNGQVAYHLKLAFDDLDISGFMSDRKFLVAARRGDDKTEMVASYDEQSFAFSSIVHVLKPFSFYADLAVDPRSKEWLFSKWGIRRYYEGDHDLRGFFMLNYDSLSNRFEGGFFIHL